MADKVRKESHAVKIEDIEAIDERLNSARSMDGKVWLLGQYNDALETLIQFMNLVIYDNDPAFKEIDIKGQKQYIAASKLANYFKLLHCMLEVYSLDLVYAPHIQLFFDVYRKHLIRYCVLHSLNRLSPNGEREGMVFDDFIAKLRKEGEQRNVTKQVADWERNYMKNRQRLHQYEKRLYRKHARIVWVRIDFLYKAACVEEAQHNDINRQLGSIATQDQAKYLHGKGEERERETIARIDIKEMMADRDHLFRNMRGKPSLFEHRVGHIWSIEWSRIGGYHMHCAFAFNGSEVHKHEWLADQIGQYWVHVITSGRGHYHNCNRGTYDDYVLGPIEYHETDKRERLLKRLEYLAKKDQFVYVKPSIKCKVFGAGRMPELSEGGPGRPRKKGPVEPDSPENGSDDLAAGDSSDDQTEGD